MQDNKVITSSLVIIVIFISGVVLRVAKPVLFPFFLAIFLSFILSPILVFLTRYKVPKTISIAFILIASFFISYLLGALFYSSGKAFASDLSGYGEKLNSILNLLQEKIGSHRLEGEPFDWTKQINFNKMANFLLSSLGPFFSFISNLFLIFVFLIFILAGRGKILSKVKTSFPDPRGKKILDIIQKIDNQIQRYLAIKTVISLITGGLAFAVLAAFRVDFALVFGFFTFILNYIPNIGSIVATILPSTMALFQFGSAWPALWILIILSAIQVILGSLVEPRVMGEGLGLSPLAVLFSLFFWGWLWGLPGMVLAVPITSIIKIICSNIPSLNFVAVLISKE